MIRRQYILLIITGLCVWESRKLLSNTFYDELQNVTEKINIDDYITLTEDMNANIGNKKQWMQLKLLEKPIVNNNGKNDWFLYT
jgi:hypothetical protein